MKGFNYKKTVQALNYIAAEYGGSINKMKAIKLIWLADRVHLRNYGRTITGDTYFAFKLGPVPSSTRDILEEASSFLSDEETGYSDKYLSIVSKNEYKSIESPQLKVFSDSDISTLDLVIKEYGGLSQFQLSDLSHDFPEWKKWESAFAQKMGLRFLINFEDFFENPVNVKPLFNDDQLSLELTKRLYLRKEDTAK